MNDAPPDVPQRRKLVHDFHQGVLDDVPQDSRPGLVGQRSLGGRLQRVVGKFQLDVIQLEQPLVLLDYCVPRLHQHPDQVFPVQGLQRRHHREPAHQLRNKPELEQILGRDQVQHRLQVRLFVRSLLVLGQEPHGRPGGYPLGDDLLQPIERPAANEKDVPGVDLEHLLVRVLPATLRRHVGNAALDDLEQLLLHPFTRNVPRDRAVDPFLACDLVQLVDIYDPLFRPGDVPIGRLDQAQQDILHVLAHIARFRQGCSVADREWHVQRSCQRLRQQGLPGTGGANQQDVGLLYFNFRVRGLAADALEMIVDRNGQGLLGLFLPDDVGVQARIDFARHQGPVSRALFLGRLVRYFDPVAGTLLGSVTVVPPLLAPALGHVVGQLADAVEADTAPGLPRRTHQPTLGKQAAAKRTTV